jgi:hypothetical protein
MSRHCLNILSVNGQVTLEILTDIAARAEPGVQIVSTIERRKIGTCTQFRLEGEDLWAEVDLEPDAVMHLEGTHAESVIALKDGKPTLCVVVVTTLARGMLDAAAQHKPFVEAVKSAVEFALHKAGIGRQA